MTDPQPEAVWVFPEKPQRGKGWLIAVLIVVALAVAAALVFFFLSQDGAPAPDASASPSASPTATPTPSATPTETPAPVPTPTPTPGEITPLPSPPPATAPDLGAFAAEVQPFLDDALTGLSIAEGSSGTDAALVVETLQGDVGRLAERAVPASISDDWSDALARYSGHLSDLHSAYVRGSDSARALAAARASVQELRGLVGL